MIKKILHLDLPGREEFQTISNLLIILKQDKDVVFYIHRTIQRRRLRQNQKVPPQTKANPKEDNHLQFRQYLT